MIDKKAQLLTMLKAQNYSWERLAILADCDVERLPDKLRITAPRGTAQFHSHFLVCDLAAVSALPVELVIK